MTAAAPAATFAVEVPPELTEAMTGGGAIARRISRDEALQVPAVLRGRNLICSTLAGLPLKIHGPDQQEADGYLLGGNIDPDVANIVTISNTLEDLLFEGIAWWQVTRFGWHGYPVEARWVPESHVHVHGTMGHPATSQVSPDRVEPRTGQIFIDGVPVSDREVIRFDSPNPPLLRHAARAIRTALKLDRTVAMYADEPFPLGALEPLEGAEPLSDAPGSAEDGTDRSEVEAMLDSWEAARRRRAWAYLQKVQAKSLAWDPKQLQLAEQRQHAVLEIARALGVDPEDLGVSTTSRTYQNGEQRRLDLLDFTLSAYVQALQQRLSMHDVLPRGYVARLKFDGFLRSDTRTRMETFRVGRQVGAYDDQRIADLEDIPVEQVRRGREQAESMDTTATREAPAMARSKPELRLVGGAEFSADEPTRVTFPGEDVAESFRASTERRTVSGIAVPWGRIAKSNFAKWKFKPDSLHWASDVRVKMNIDHDRGQTIGRGVRLQSSPPGLDVTFRVARGAEGDRALALAEDGVYDGFSIEVDFDGEADGWTPDPQDESVRLVHSATLRAVALTAMPAFDDARLTSVAATREGVGAMPENKQGGTGQAPPTEKFDIAEHVTKLSESMVETHKKLTEDLTESFGASVSEGIKAALENIYDPQRDGPQPVRAARYTVGREAPVYSLNGSGPCLVRDAWNARFHGDNDAYERLKKFHFQSEEMAKVVQSRLQFASSSALQFTPSSTSNASEIIPPGYRPDLFVPQLVQQRPFVSALSRGTISNATPFVVPVFGSASGATADHVEGTPPTDGTLTFDTTTVTPGAISGLLKLTREIVDSSNPAIDQIALAAMRESYAQQTEAKVYAMLNTAQSGTITNGFATSGAQVSDTTTGDGAELLAAVRTQLALYPFRRFAAPNQALMSQRATTFFATAVDDVGRPLLPSVGAQNTAGLGNAVTQGWFVDGLAHVPAWAITEVGAGEGDVFTLNSMDAWAWESPTLTFRYEERSGPTFIDLALFGYFATHLLRPVGLSVVRTTAAV
jgi:HK97 family phage prohead protease